MSGGPAILIMAKAPLPREVKTRLEPLLGAERCGALQAELIRHTVAWALGAAPAVALAFAPARARARMAALVPPGVGLFAQAGGGLGARLEHATGRIFAGGGGPLVVIGTDAPLLGSRHVAGAARALAGGADACLVPALDGGYTLIALARRTPAAFAIPPAAWGGPHVLELTLAALSGAGLTAALLDPVADLDTPADARALLEGPRCPAGVRALLSRSGAVAA